MSQAGEQTAAAPDAPKPEQRTCVKCAAAKIVSPESWPYRKGRTGVYQAHGGICMVCHRKAKAEYEKRRDKVAALVADVPSVPANGDKGVKAQQQAAITASKLDVAKALKAGSKVLNEFAPAVLARVLSWFEDEEHPQHVWAVQFLSERIVPRKLYEELGGQAAGLGGLQDKRPQIIVQVMPAAPSEPAGRLIEGESTTVSVLPAPTPE